jgi:hypothetical protein
MRGRLPSRDCWSIRRRRGPASGAFPCSGFRLSGGRPPRVKGAPSGRVACGDGATAPPLTRAGRESPGPLVACRIRGRRGRARAGRLPGWLLLPAVAVRALSRRFPLTGRGRPHNRRPAAGGRTSRPLAIGASCRFSWPLTLTLACAVTLSGLGRGQRGALLFAPVAGAPVSTLCVKNVRECGFG